MNEWMSPAQRNTPPCALPSRYRLAPPASTLTAPKILQGIDLQLFFTLDQRRYLYRSRRRLRPARSGAAALSLHEHALDLAAVGFDARHAGGHVDLEAVALEHVLALGQHDPAHHGDEVGPRIEDSGLAGHDLVLLRNHHRAFGFQPADRRAAAGPGGCRLHRPGFRSLRRGRRRRGGRRRRRSRAGIVEHDKRLRGHGGVALHDLHISGEGRLLFLVAHFERRRLDLNRLVAVLRKALHRVRHARHGALRQGVTGGDQRERKRCGRKTAREELHHEDHFVFDDLPVTDRVLGGGAGSGSGSGAGGLSMIRLITTLPSKRTISPLLMILSRSAVSVPFSNLTSTCSSDVTVPLLMST